MLKMYVMCLQNSTIKKILQTFKWILIPACGIMSSISIVTMYRIYIWFYWTLFLLFLTKNVNLKGVW